MGAKRILGLLLLLVAVLFVWAVAGNALNLAFLLPGANVSLPKKFAPEVVLTFDDGPDKSFTPQIAKLLAQRGVPATFFLLGKHVKEHPQVVRELSSMGFEVASHGYSHEDLSKMSAERVKWEVTETSRLLESITGTKPRFFRPPFGSFNGSVVSSVRGNGMVTILWTVDSRDWTKQGAERVAQRVTSQAKPGSVILLHSTQPDTLEALPRILEGLAGKKLKVVSLESWYLTNFGKKTLPAVRTDSKQEEQAIETLPTLPVAPVRIFGPIAEVEPRATSAGEMRGVEQTEGATLKGSASSEEIMDASLRYHVYSNVADLSQLYNVFPYEDYLPRLEPLKGEGSFSWQAKLPSRPMHVYERNALLNGKRFSDGFYPQPRFFLLLSPEQAFKSDAEFLKELFDGGGFSECLILGDTSQVETGDFGIPASYVAPGEFDPTAVFTLGEDSIAELLKLFEAKKESIFVLLGENAKWEKNSGGDEGMLADKVSEVFKFALEEFLVFRQLTFNRVYDPAKDLVHMFRLPQEFTLARFSSGDQPIILIAQDKPAWTLITGGYLSRFDRLTLSPGESAKRGRIKPRELVQAERSFIFLVPR